ncbi:MAG: SIS domain-containing protein [Proteobacteria bacterium]|nr:SIS domain-containing protein [Pseudomonadota bacterium]
MGVRDVFREHLEAVTAASASLPDVLEAVGKTLQRCLEGGGKILTCGNGGSAADAQHLASELVGRVRRHRRALPAVALTTDASVLTAIANDYGFSEVFARQVRALASPGDVLVAISASGDSANVVEAARAARDAGCSVVALTGRGGGRLAEHADLLVAAPSDDVCRIQEIHGLCIHAVCEGIEAQAPDAPDEGGTAG